MSMIAVVLSWIVAALHLLFGFMESVGWTQMAQRFGYSKEATEITRTLALNQGAYNAGVAVVLAWALLSRERNAAVAMLGFVVAMAAVGGVSVRWTIFVIQGVPALLALGAMLAAR